MDDDQLREWRRLYDEREATVAPLKAQLEAIEERFTAAMAPLEAGIRAAAMASQASHKAGGVHVVYRSGYEKVNWDGKKLDGYAVAHPELLAFRAVTQVAPGVSFKAI